MTRLAACLMPYANPASSKHRGDRDGSPRRTAGRRSEEYELVAAESACSAGDPLAGHPAQRINMLTEHKDVMTTLMQRLLHVSTPANEYSQGQDLFSATRRHNWVTAAGNDTLAVTTPMLTLVLNNNGNYQTYNLQGERLKDRNRS